MSKYNSIDKSITETPRFVFSYCKYSTFRFFFAHQNQCMYKISCTFCKLLTKSIGANMTKILKKKMSYLKIYKKYFCKINCSTDQNERFKQLQTASGNWIFKENQQAPT